MKLLLFLLLFTSIQIFAYDVNVISNPVSKQEQVSSPTVSVDIFGNSTWQYPTDFFEPNKPKNLQKK